MMRALPVGQLIAFFVIAAIVTPTPDVINLCIFALPTIALYLLGVAAAAIVPLLHSVTARSSMFSNSRTLPGNA